MVSTGDAPRSSDPGWRPAEKRQLNHVSGNDLFVSAVHIESSTPRVYGGNVTKTLIDIDDATLDRAKRALGTTTKKDTVNQSLAAVVALAARRRDLERFTTDSHADLRDADIMSNAWQR